MSDVNRSQTNLDKSNLRLSATLWGALFSRACAILAKSKMLIGWRKQMSEWCCMKKDLLVLVVTWLIGFVLPLAWSNMSSVIKSFLDYIFYPENRGSDLGETILSMSDYEACEQDGAAWAMRKRDDVYFNLGSVWLLLSFLIVRDSGMQNIQEEFRSIKLNSFI